MGSKTPLEHRRGSDESSADAAISASNPPKPAAASGLVQGVLEGQEDSGDEDEDQNVGSDLKAVAKKRKRKNRKKKKKTSSGLQTAPPTVELSTIFKDQLYPEGEIVEYDTGSHNTQRTTAQELRHQAALENMDDDFLKDYRKAAEVHRQVRQYAQTIIKPGVSMSRIAQEIESGVRALVGHQGIETGDPLKAGMGFPTGLCLNNIGAHWTPNPGSKEIILDKDDVLSVDFGVHVNGRIVDSAFTVAFNPVYDTLLEAVREATNVGIKEAGIDARIAPISAAMQDVMESYEVELNGKTIPVKAVRTIAGHNILRYKIHGDKQVPFVRHRSTQRMEEGDVFAIETFGSTGSGWFQDGNEVYGYSRNDHVSGAGLRQASAKALLKSIDENFGTIPFARSYLERVGVQNYLHPMKTLVSSGIVESYPPLVDIPGSYVAQFEHTVLLRPNCKEVITRGDDY